MKRKIFLTISCATIWVGSCFAQETNVLINSVLPRNDAAPFVEKHDLDLGASHGYATLNIEKPVVKVGGDLSVEVRFFNTGEGQYFFNPFFESLIARPAQMALYDSNHHYIGNLIRFYSGSGRLVSSEDWIFIPSGASTGVKMQLNTRINWKDIPPGNYYLQVIFYKAFIALNPAKSGDTSLQNEQSRLESFVKNFDRNELFRSNSVKITIIE